MASGSVRVLVAMIAGSCSWMPYCNEKKTPDVNRLLNDLHLHSPRFIPVKTKYKAAFVSIVSDNRLPAGLFISRIDICGDQ